MLLPSGLHQLQHFAINCG